MKKMLAALFAGVLACAGLFMLPGCGKCCKSKEASHHEKAHHEAKHKEHKHHDRGHHDHAGHDHHHDHHEAK